MTSRFQPLALLFSLPALSLVALPGCVEDLDFIGFPEDAGVDAGTEPPPPVFPLRAGDELVYAAVGGRAEPCNLGEGGCQRALRATYTVNDVKLDEDTNRWRVDADFLYEGTADTIEAAAMGQLFMTGVAPFSSLAEGQSSNGDATFRADGAPTDGIEANEFPFFHFEPAYATREDSAYRSASSEFARRVQELDPQAALSNQAAQAKMEAYFRDERGVNAMLHEVVVQYHPMGFVCDWRERLVPWADGMTRNEASFGNQGIPLASSFFTPVTLVRGDDRYNCSCLSNTCYQRTDQTLCLDPAAPDGDPVRCDCLNSETAPDDCP